MVRDLFILTILISTSQIAQINSDFNIQLMLDFKSAEQCVALYEDQHVSIHSLTSARGNRISVSTTGLILNRGSVANTFENFLDSLKNHWVIQNDIYHLEEARKNVNGIKELLEELKNRNFNRRVVATVEQIFPEDAKLSLTIPVYVVALGHENVDAYVRRIVWHDEYPQFVGENQGELTIILNLAHSVKYGSDVEERFISLLGVVAHEVFHAAFSDYKNTSSLWKRFYRDYRTPFDALLDLTQNEGIAYYLSLEQQGRGSLPRDWNRNTREAFMTFNSSATELLSEAITHKRANELIQKANLSGYWKNYGSMTGMFIAREIDIRLGRAALIETIARNPFDFFKKYINLTNQDSNLPKFSTVIIGKISRQEDIRP